MLGALAEAGEKEVEAAYGGPCVDRGGWRGEDGWDEHLIAGRRIMPCSGCGLTHTIPGDSQITQTCSPHKRFPTIRPAEFHSRGWSAVGRAGCPGGASPIDVGRRALPARLSQHRQVRFVLTWPMKPLGVSLRPSLV